MIGSSSRSRPVLASIQCVRVWSGKLIGTRSLPWSVLPIAAKPLKVSVNGEELVMNALACLAVSKSAIDLLRAQFSRKKTACRALVKSNGSIGIRFNEAVGFGLDFQVDKDPRAAGSLEGKNTMSWGGAAGTWFWIDPTNDVLFVGMIQRMGGTGGDDLGTMARTLTYQALLHPEK